MSTKRLGAAISLLFVPSFVLAQEASTVDVNAEVFRPVPGYGFLGVPEARLLPHLGWSFDALLNFAQNPVVVTSEGSGEALATIVGSQSALDLVGAIGIKDRLQLGFAFPVALFQSGDDQNFINASVSGGRPGDLRLSAKVRLLGDPKKSEGFSASFIPELTLPTGDGENLFGAASPTGLLALSAGFRTSRVAVSAMAGPRFQEDVTVANLNLGDSIEFGVGASFAINDKLILLAESNGAISLDELGIGQSPAEARLGARVQAGKNVWVPVGVGAGLTDGFGSPDFRVLVGLSFSPELGEAPSNEGILVKVDECANGCPDTDGDKIADKEDACPGVAGILEREGCPEEKIIEITDADQDGVADSDDACPQTPGAALEGCPDTDSDAIADHQDKCPQGREDGKGKSPEDGCPDEGRATITDGSIYVLDKVYFDANKDTLQERSYVALDAVVTILKEHPEIKKLEVQGHTDDVGKDKYNLALSTRRAKRVVEYLTREGIDASRLTFEGYGEAMPIVPLDGAAKTDKAKLTEAREQNRRVEFKIIEN